MIHLLYGPNAYGIRQAQQALVAAARADYGSHGVERYDGEALTAGALTDVLRGASLFAPQKLVVLSDVSRNRAVWEALAEHLPQLPEGVDVCLVETAPDKRTKTFKLLQKIASLSEHAELNEAQAAEWLVSEAERRGSRLSSAVARSLVQRAGLDQWRLSNELDKLALADVIDQARLEALVEPTPQANVFALLDAALNRQPKQLRSLVRAAAVTEDAYKLIGLLASQVVQLAALVVGGERSPELIARDLQTHPYPLKKMQPLARRTSLKDVQVIATTIAELDRDTKSTGLEPWLLLERSLIKIASR